MECGLTNYGTSMKYGGPSSAGRLSRPSDRNWNPGLSGSSEKGGKLTGRDLGEIVKLLECKLAWWGFRSIEVGPFIRVSDHTISIDLHLMDGGRVLCRIEVDRDSGLVDPSAGGTLSRLLKSQREP